MPWVWYSPVPDLWIRCSEYHINPLNQRVRVTTYRGDIIDNLRFRRVGDSMVVYEQ